MSARAIVADALTGVKVGVHAQCWLGDVASAHAKEWLVVGALTGAVLYEIGVHALHWLGETMSARAIVADALTGVKVGVHAQCWLGDVASAHAKEWLVVGALTGAVLYEIGVHALHWLGETMSARAIVADALTGVKLGVHAQCWLGDVTLARGKEWLVADAFVRVKLGFRVQCWLGETLACAQHRLGDKTSVCVYDWLLAWAERALGEAEHAVVSWVGGAGVKVVPL